MLFYIYYIIILFILDFYFTTYIMPADIPRADVSFQMDSGVELLSKLRSDGLPVLRRAVAQDAVSYFDWQEVEHAIAFELNE